MKKNNKPKFKTLKTLTPEKFKDTRVEMETRMHQPIKLGMYISFKLLLMNFLGCLFCKCARKTKDNQLLKLYENGSKRLKNDLSVERIIKNLRDMRILLKSKFLDHDTLFEIQFNHKNVINLEEDENGPS